MKGKGGRATWPPSLFVASLPAGQIPYNDRLIFA